MFKKSLCSKSKWSKLPCKTQPLKNFWNFCLEKYLLFNLVTKRRSHQPYKLPLSTVHNCCNKEKDVAAKIRTSVVGQLLMASVCQSLSQNWSTAVWYLLITTHINLCLNVTTISNSFWGVKFWNVSHDPEHAPFRDGLTSAGWDLLP